MDGTRKSDIKPPKPDLLIFLPAGIGGLLALVYLLIIPSDPKHSIFQGYSLNRMVMITTMLTLTGGVMTLWQMSRRSDLQMDKIEDALFSRTAAVLAWAVLVGSALALIATLPGMTELNPAYGERLRPFILWALLCGGLVLNAQHESGLVLKIKPQPLLQTYQKIIRVLVQSESKANGWFLDPKWQIAGVLLIAAPLTLWNAFEHSLPVGYAGLYALMAEGIASSGFSLPVEIPFYGPGGIPFAYPPLGFYLMAIATKFLGVAPLDYMRFAPPVLCLLALIPMYLLSRQLISTPWGAFIATLFMAAAWRPYAIHGLAAGLVRALAFGVALSSLYFFSRVLREFSWRDTLLTGFFFGLAMLSHPTYAEFCAASAVVFALIGLRGGHTPLFFRLRSGMVMALVGIIVSAPWWFTILTRHGPDVFGAASGSFDTLGFINLLFEPKQLWPFIADALYKLNKTPLLAALAGVGSVFSLATLDLLLPVWMAVNLIIWLGYDLFLVPIAALLAGNLMGTFHSNPRGKLLTPATTLLTVAMVGAFYWQGFVQIKQHEPVISTEIITLGQWFQENTPETSTFLRMSNSPEEIEWYPYFLQRTPILGSWGSEWTGNYHHQLGLVGQLTGCSTQMGYDCLGDLITAIGEKPDYLITNKGMAKMNEEAAQNGWGIVYESGQYIVWHSEI